MRRAWSAQLHIDEIEPVARAERDHGAGVIGELLHVGAGELADANVSERPCSRAQALPGELVLRQPLDMRKVAELVTCRSAATRRLRQAVRCAISPLPSCPSAGVKQRTLPAAGQRGNEFAVAIDDGTRAARGASPMHS